jgi:molybdopterin/thiamine biosynthesis adenylyltransferase
MDKRRRRVRSPAQQAMPEQERELHFALSQALSAELDQLLFPSREPGLSEHGVIGIVHRSTGARRTTLLLRSLVEPKAGEVTWDTKRGLLFSPKYKSRAVDAASSTPGAGLIFIHTHPAGSRPRQAPRPSPQDLEADRNDLYTLGRFLDQGAPLVAAIVGTNRAWSVRGYSFRFPRTADEVRESMFAAAAGKMTYASVVRVVGPGIRKLPTRAAASGPAGASGAIADRLQDSSIRLWGQEGQRVLASLRIGIVGAGGVGAILSEHVARLGVGETVLVDFDRIRLENFNRSQGATRGDVAAGRRKVDVAKRNADRGATAPAFRAYAIEGSAVEAQAIPFLLDCDVILDAADSPWARQVLDHLAFAHLIPVIHGGTILKGDPGTGLLIAGKSEVSATGPGHPCSECSFVYSRADVTEAQEAPNLRGAWRYIDYGTDDVDREDRAPSVICFNALVAGLMQLRLLAISLGTTPDAVVGTQRYHPIYGTLDLAPTTACRQECDRRQTTAMGDSYPLPLGRDMDYAAVRERLKRHARPGQKVRGVR